MSTESRNKLLYGSRRWSTYETAMVIKHLQRHDDYRYWQAVAESTMRETSWAVCRDGERLESPAIDHIAEMLASQYQNLPKEMNSDLFEEFVQASLWRVNWKE